MWNEEILGALELSRPGTSWLEDLSEIEEEDEEVPTEKESGSRRQVSAAGGDGDGECAFGVGAGVIRKKPRAIRSSAYRVLAADPR